MSSLGARRLILPATLAVTTLTVATLLACRDPSHEAYCVDIEKQERCERAEHCGWDEASGLCVNTCHEVTDMAACEAIEFCEWSLYGGSAESDTGEGESCHEAIIT